MAGIVAYALKGTLKGALNVAANSPYGAIGAAAGVGRVRSYAKYGVLGAGLLVGSSMQWGAASLAWNVPDAFSSYQRASESMVMSRMLLNAQSGPYGPSAASMGMRSGNANTAGLVLAAHYAKNRNKHFGMFGLRYL